MCNEVVAKSKEEKHQYPDKVVKDFHNLKIKAIQEVSIKRWICPVCSHSFFSDVTTLKEVQSHMDFELNWQARWRNAKPGDPIKILDQEKDDGSIERIAAIGRFGWCYEGYSCGNLCTVFENEYNQYWTARGGTKYLFPIDSKELEEYLEVERQKNVSKLTKELEILSKESGVVNVGKAYSVLGGCE